jgi:hypothetical protein
MLEVQQQACQLTMPTAAAAVARSRVQLAAAVNRSQSVDSGDQSSTSLLVSA